MSAPRFPSRLQLPFGYLVRIDQVTREEMDERGGTGCDGYWDPTQRMISIIKTLPLERKRYLVYHELTHALADAGHMLMNEGVLRP